MIHIDEKPNSLEKVDKSIALKVAKAVQNLEQDEDDDPDAATAFFTKAFKQIFNKGKLQGNAPRRELKDVVCFNCNEKGHFARNCTKSKTEKSAEKQKALVAAWE